ncbi:MAG: EamA family transporter [Gemmatimonadetes bacterium]|nr:EamA family transporter [Gemmatimonadota bacterium]
MKSVAAQLPDGARLSPLLLVRGMESPLVWIGILLLLVFLGLFLSTLSREDLSFVLPVLSVGYILNVASARVFLHEPVSPVRWAGTVFIVLGVVMVSVTARATSRAAEGAAAPAAGTGAAGAAVAEAEDPPC